MPQLLVSFLKLSQVCIDLNYPQSQVRRDVEESSLSNERVRSFVAIDIDNPETLSAVSSAQRDLMATGADLKTVEPKNMHLTIWFLGEIPYQTLENVKEALSGLKFSPFDFRLAGIGYFPGGRSVRVIWAGIQDPAGQLNHIYTQLCERLGPLGFKPEHRGFSAHLTLARVRSNRGRDALLAKIADIRAAVLGQQHVDSVKLKRSVLTPKGPIYSDLYAALGE